MSWYHCPFTVTASSTQKTGSDNLSFHKCIRYRDYFSIEYNFSGFSRVILPQKMEVLFVYAFILPEMWFVFYFSFRMKAGSFDSFLQEPQTEKKIFFFLFYGSDVLQLSKNYNKWWKHRVLAVKLSLSLPHYALSNKTDHICLCL